MAFFTPRQNSHQNLDQTSRWACSYFFIICGLAYGSVMTRMPAIKLQTELDEAQLGYALLWLGLGALTAFPLAGWAISKIGSRYIQIGGGLALLFLFPLIGLASGQWTLSFTLYGMGIATGCTEVAMSTQAVLVERHLAKPCMSSLHAMFSLGGLCGSLGSSLLAGLNFSPLSHFYLVAGLVSVFLPWASRHLLKDPPAPKTTKTKFIMPPAIVFVCGLLALCCYSSEGAVGDWGALLLHDIKGASEQVSALAYAAFAVAMVIARLSGDRLRETFGDHKLMFFLSCLATAGILTSQFSPWAWVCLLGYACMGLGLSVCVPIIFSSVGKRTDISAGTGAAIISSLGYGGQLMVPPLIGVLGHNIGLHNAMFVVVFLCLCLVAGSSIFKTKN